MILKKSVLQALVGRKKIACNTNEIEKNSCTAASKRKKNVAKLFNHSWGALQNPSKTAAPH